ncbi:hypothetical protein [Candidatus Marinarcus aquaticus]|uniref:Uncharacterized protein n=1 Tax=Candidatus Marinarcus aquaticus TaxID=2044504 RepID=A0A4V1LPA8_9BACT|nr:hypothetical protein [Candidatus Marinarcus aquaticus]RXJ60548.1 hypothetical protein CRV04_00595 [Candidatus Marinarcus aquaticus]
MKKSFALLITLFLVLLFSLLGYQIISTKTLQSYTLSNAYMSEQARVHQLFFKSFLLNQSNFECQNELVFDEGLFQFKAKIEYIEGSCNSGHARIDTFITSKSERFSIRLHERFLKKL